MEGTHVNRGTMAIRQADFDVQRVRPRYVAGIKRRRHGIRQRDVLPYAPIQFHDLVFLDQLGLHVASTHYDPAGSIRPVEMVGPNCRIGY